jgi:protein phosphatase 1G
MVIACDGIWNFMSSQDVVDFVRIRIEKKTLAQICEEVSFIFFI